VSPGDCCFFRTGSPLRFQWNWFLISDVMITVLDFIPRYANSIKNFQILQDFLKLLRNISKCLYTICIILTMSFFYEIIRTRVTLSFTGSTRNKGVPPSKDHQGSASIDFLVIHKNIWIGRKNKVHEGYKNKSYEILLKTVFLTIKEDINEYPLEAKGFIFRTNRSFFSLITPILSSTVKPCPKQKIHQQAFLRNILPITGYSRTGKSSDTRTVPKFYPTGNHRSMK
jgi:hypothetical protein